jgi:hypothetical protein
LAHATEVILESGERLTIYGLIGKIFGMDEDFTMFIMQVIPALALDLIASLSLYIALFPVMRKETT